MRVSRKKEYDTYPFLERNIVFFLARIVSLSSQRVKGTGYRVLGTGVSFSGVRIVSLFLEYRILQS